MSQQTLIMSEEPISQPPKPKRLSSTTKQRMLVDYLKDGTVPEGFYVHIQKDGIIQFRRKKEKKANNSIISMKEDVQAKIKRYQQRIASLQAQAEQAEVQEQAEQAEPEQDFDEFI